MDSSRVKDESDSRVEESLGHFLRDLYGTDFFGTVEIIIQGGKVHRVKKTQHYHPKDLI